MFVFLLSQTPLPIILYLNLRVTAKFIRVRRMSKAVPVEKPRRLIIGWWLNNVAFIFALIPPITERRIFVQDSRWLLSYAISAGLSIIGLILMNSALGEELRELAGSPRPKSRVEAVDMNPSDTL